MTWRRFGVLLRGLSSNSALWAVHRHRRGRPGAQHVNTPQTPEEAERAFAAAFGPPGSAKA